MDELKPTGFETADALDRFRAVRRGQPFNLLWPSDVDEAIEALEDKLNRRAAPENNPLTLEQLRQIDGEPVYIVYQSIDGIKHGTWAINWNAMKSASNGYLNFKHKNYGKTWLAYTRKPEKEEHHA